MNAPLRSLRQADRNRAGVPGEHWITLGAGAGLLRWAGRAASPWLRAAAVIAGGLLVLRALSGRDGPLARSRAGNSPS